MPVLVSGARLPRRFPAAATIVPTSGFVAPVIGGGGARFAVGLTGLYGIGGNIGFGLDQAGSGARHGTRFKQCEPVARLQYAGWLDANLQTKQIFERSW